MQNDLYLAQLSCYIHRNPLRAGLVNRLADYRWSSYRAYAYKTNHADCLKKDLILSQFGGWDSFKAYREKVQKYSEESANLFEDLRHGFFLGTKVYLDAIGKKHLAKKPDAELPQLNRIIKDKDPVKSLECAAKAIRFDLNKLRQSKRTPKEDIPDRDILLYCLKETGFYTNKQIGDLFNLTYSAVSRRAANIRLDLSKQAGLRRKYDLIKSRIKV